MLRRMLRSLEVPWSEQPSAAERLYRAAGLQRTAGTLFLLPPSRDELVEAFNARHKGRELTVGARALCKHYERRQSVNVEHPFWVLPIGSEDSKSETARKVLDSLMNDACWQNVLLLHPGVAVYEMRMAMGYGLRWTLELDSGESTHSIRRITFRGFLEPPANSTLPATRAARV